MNPALIITAISAAEQLIVFIIKARSDLAQGGELTPDQEKALDDKIDGLKSKWDQQLSA